MSYCVNCGVELDKTCSVCPLCNTKVINPMQAVDNTSPKPYPSKKGHIAPVQRRDLTVLMTVILAATSIVCGLLNLLLFNTSLWSLYVMGVCAVLWIFFLPIFFPEKLHAYVCLLLDGMSIVMYFGIIAFLHPGNGWYFAIAIPLIILCTLLVVIYAFCIRYKHHSILSLAVVFIAELAVLSISIELLVQHYLHDVWKLSWSAIVLTCCIIIDAALLTILRTTRLREEVRRRMHI